MTAPLTTLTTFLVRATPLVLLSTLLSGCLELSMWDSYAWHRPSRATARPTGSVTRLAPAPGVYGAPSPQERQAWHLLEQRCAGDAASAFAREITCAPTEARLYVGLALAQAASGDLCGGSQAMRSALRVDPDVLETVTVSPRLDALLADLISEYRYDLRLGAPVGETTLTLAALQTLRGDLVRAADSLDLCHRAGGRTPLTARLAASIDRRLAPPPRIPRSPAPRPSIATTVAPPAPKPAPEADSIPEFVRAPETEPTPEPAPEPTAPTAPEPPREPVDYDQLRTGIRGASEALDRFTEKLRDRLEQP